MKGSRLSLSVLDFLVLAALCALALLIFFRLGSGFNYRWNWSAVIGYIAFFDSVGNTWRAGILLQGLFITCKLSVWGMLLGTILGCAVGMLSLRRRLFFRLCAKSYVELIRNTPALVLVFIFYFFVSDQLMPLLHIEGAARSLTGVPLRIFSAFFCEPQMLTQFLSGAITLGLFQGAYIAEIIRAGIQSIHYGQQEAAAALGLSPWQQMRLVILPQALRNMLPPLANEFINTIKYSSIVSIISIQELTFQGMQVMASTQVTIEVWLIITLLYLILCFSLSLTVSAMEKRLQRART